MGKQLSQKFASDLCITILPTYCTLGCSELLTIFYYSDRALYIGKIFAEKTSELNWYTKKIVITAAMSLEIKHISMSSFGAFFHSHWWEKILTMHGMGKTCQVVYGVFVHSNGVHVINARGAGMHEERTPGVGVTGTRTRSVSVHCEGVHSRSVHGVRMHNMIVHGVDMLGSLVIIKDLSANGRRKVKHSGIRLIILYIK